MDPLTLGIAAVGIGMQAYGMFGANEAQEQAQASAQRTAVLEQQVNAQRRNAMELNARRQQLEIYRNAQRARAQGTAAAVNQGASKGSGLQGGLAQVYGQSAFNLQGVTQNLEIGRNIFGLNDQISKEKALQSSYQSEAATYGGIASFGGSVTGSAGTLGKFAGYASAPSGPITLGTSYGGHTPFSPSYS